MSHYPLSVCLYVRRTGTSSVLFSSMYLAHGISSISICWMIWWTLHQGLDYLSHFLNHSFSIFRGSTQSCLGFWYEQGPLEPVSVGSKHFPTFRFNTHWFGIWCVGFILSLWLTQKLTTIFRILKWSHSVVSNSATAWTVAHQTSGSMGFSRHKYQNGLPFPSPGDLPDPGLEPQSPSL